MSLERLLTFSMISSRLIDDYGFSSSMVAKRRPWKVEVEVEEDERISDVR